MNEHDQVSKITPNRMRHNREAAMLVEPMCVLHTSLGSVGLFLRFLSIVARWQV